MKQENRPRRSDDGNKESKKNSSNVLGVCGSYKQKIIFRHRWVIIAKIEDKRSKKRAAIVERISVDE